MPLSYRNAPSIPLVFLGLGLYRAWIELVWVGDLIDSPALYVAGQDLFDLSMVFALVACAALSRKITPLFRKRLLLGTAVACMSIGTVLNCLSLYLPNIASDTAVPAAVLSGAGAAFIILIWSELYSCLPAHHVALYYSASLLACAFTVLVCAGFVMDYRCVVGALLPVASLCCCLRAFRMLPSDDLPRLTSASVSFPWKPVLLMAVYAFAYGLRENDLLAMMGPMSSPGTIVAAFIVFCAVFFRTDRVNLDAMYRIALPAMICALVFVPVFGPQNAFLANSLASLSYTAFSIFIMIVLSGISHRYGVSAVFLFGMERGIRALFSFLGRETQSAFDALSGSPLSSETTVSIALVVVVICCAMLLVSEQDIRSRWGISLYEDGTGSQPRPLSAGERNRLELRCAELQSAYGLSPREEEVLLLLAQRKSIRAIQEELSIANGTAKAHVRHIYEKLGVHTREELFEVVG